MKLRLKKTPENTPSNPDLIPPNNRNNNNIKYYSAKQLTNRSPKP